MGGARGLVFVGLDENFFLMGTITFIRILTIFLTPGYAEQI